MIDQIVAALKISLNECNKISNPTEYTKEIVATLSRYKTNLFKMLAKEDNFEQDPKEAIQLRIGSSWRTKPALFSKIRIIDSSPVILYVNGTAVDPRGRMNREKVYNKAYDISDIIDIEKIVGIKTDWYTTSTSPKKDEDEEAETTSSIDGMYLSLDRRPEDIIEFNLQFNGSVYYSAMREHQDRSASRMASDANVSLNTLAKRVAQKTALEEIIKNLPPEDPTPLNSLTKAKGKNLSASSFRRF